MESKKEKEREEGIDDEIVRIANENLVILFFFLQHASVFMFSEWHETFAYVRGKTRESRPECETCRRLSSDVIDFLNNSRASPRSRIIRRTRAGDCGSVRINFLVR